MQIRRADFQSCSEADGTVVVIDVLRAFSAAAVGFVGGAREIVLAGGLEEALALRREMPDARLLGEVGGLRSPGFDFPNSPARLAEADLSGRRLIQYTGAGTAAASRCARADSLFVASFVCAGATARTLQAIAPPAVTFVVSGSHCGWDGDEDAACADYVAALLTGETPNPGPYIERALASVPGRFLADVRHPEYEEGDLACCTAIDYAPFVMRVYRESGRLVVRASR